MSDALNFCLHELIEAQAERSPDAVALVCGEQQLTYREMNERANRLAHYLRTLGVGPEHLVGIAAERAIETPIAILGVLKAGAAYLPLDPVYPAARLRLMLGDSGARIVLMRRWLRDVLPTTDQIIVYTDDARQLADLPAANPAPCATPDHLAYLLYTSGSTGTPKGVLVPHRQIVHSTSARFAYDQGYEPAAFLLLVSFSFDGSACGLYWTLCRGGRLVIPVDEQLQDLGAIRELIRREQITHLDCAPSLYTLILGDDGALLQSLRHANLGGEACPPQLVAQHYRLLPNARLINDYGPTEATVWSTRLECRPEHGAAASVPIGRPIPNVQIHLLDERLAPVPDGEPGELYVAGAGVARGYLGRPDLTAERFIPNPFLKDEGGRIKDESGTFSLHPSSFRLYRTGDLARCLPDGNIEFLGRNDEQVKIRGYRIEPGEIEIALLHHPQVMQAAVILRADSADLKRLIAYFVARDGAALARQELISFLNQRLPPYMVPRAFVFLDKLPRSPTGKIDRQHLASLEVQPEVEGAYVAPQTPLEQEIAQALGAILGIARVGRDDDFFDLGGDSLTLARLMTFLSSTYDIHIHETKLFDRPTVAGVAQVIEGYRSGGLGGIPGRDMTQLEAEMFLDLTIVPEWSSAEPGATEDSTSSERSER